MGKAAAVQDITESQLARMSPQEKRDLDALIFSYASFKSLYRNDPAGFTHDCFRWPEGERPTSYQDESLDLLARKRRVAVRGPHGLGKAQPHDLVIDTPAGRRRFGDLAVGDEVFGVAGQRVAITGIFERGAMDVYRVVFSDGTSTLCTADHLWTVRGFNWQMGWRNQEARWETRSLGELVALGLKRSNGKAKARKWAVPTIQPLQYPYRWVPIDPYTLGAWLGDGSRRSNRISGNDREVLHRIRRAGYTVTERQDRSCMTWYVSRLEVGLRQLGLRECGARDKHVPSAYLQNLPDVRREVLRGLLDTDGTVTPEGTISFCSVSAQLADDVAWLARSLGGMARVHRTTKADGAARIVLLTLPIDRWFYIERKQARVKPISQKRYLWRWIDRVEPVGMMPVRCINVAADDGLYVANDAIVTHNTTIAAHAVLWFSLTRDGEDWKIITTAGAWRQLTNYLWPEIHKWTRLIRWERVGRPRFVEKQDLLDLALKLDTGEATAVASDQPQLIEGAHADHLLYIYDESKAIPDKTFDAAEGAFSGAGPETKREALALAISTPGAPEGRFYDIHARKRAFMDWSVRHVTVEEAKAAGRISESWQDARRIQWGEDSAIYQNRVLGEFAASQQGGVIPLAWVELANQRWLAWYEARKALPPDPKRRLLRLKAIGVDVAWEGDDRTTLAPREDNIITEIDIYRKQDPIETGKRVKEMHLLRGGIPIVDVVGLGGGTVAWLRGDGQLPTTIAFNAGAAAVGANGSKITDDSGEVEFVDLRSACWWHLRELLDPTKGHGVGLPPDDMLPQQDGEEPPSLAGELTAPRWDAASGRIKVESKKDIAKRLHRSTDLADPVMQAFALEFLQLPFQGVPELFGVGPSKWTT